MPSRQRMAGHRRRGYGRFFAAASFTQVSHLAAGALPRFAEDLNAGASKAAASCNLDVTCYPNWAETAKAVAQIV